VRKLLTALIMISLTTIMIAKEIDLTKSKGTEQERIVSLHPEPAQNDVTKDIMTKVVFDVALDAKHIKKNDITLEKLSDKKRKIIGTIAYLADEKAVTFKPNTPLEVGYYEIKIKSIKPIKEEKKEKIKEIKYRFYVPDVEIINGINNSTLLGIDSNNNGVRDDVERLIIIEEAKNPNFPKTHTAISLQYGQAWQKMIENPTIESRKFLEDASACKWYFSDKNTKNFNNYSQSRKWRIENDGADYNLEDKIFNTKERIERRFQFNEACSGHIFDLRKAELNACQTDIDKLGE